LLEAKAYENVKQVSFYGYSDLRVSLEGLKSRSERGDRNAQRQCYGLGKCSNKSNLFL